MKKILWIVFAVGVCTYFGYSAITSRNARLDKERHQTSATKTIQDTVLRMVRRNGAIDDWDTELTKGDDIGIAPVMTIDLERLWLQGRPIMFSGIISDIRTFDNQYYTVTIDRSPYFNNKVLFFPTELRLELRAEKNVIDSFITSGLRLKPRTH